MRHDRHDMTLAVTVVLNPNTTSHLDIQVKCCFVALVGRKQCGKNLENACYHFLLNFQVCS